MEKPVLNDFKELYGFFSALEDEDLLRFLVSRTENGVTYGFPYAVKNRDLDSVEDEDLEEICYPIEVPFSDLGNEFEKATNEMIEKDDQVPLVVHSIGEPEIVIASPTVLAVINSLHPMPQQVQQALLTGVPYLNITDDMKRFLENYSIARRLFDIQKQIIFNFRGGAYRDFNDRKLERNALKNLEEDVDVDDESRRYLEILPEFRRELFMRKALPEDSRRAIKSYFDIRGEETVACPDEVFRKINHSVLPSNVTLDEIAATMAYMRDDGTLQMHVDKQEEENLKRWGHKTPLNERLRHVNFALDSNGLERAGWSSLDALEVLDDYLILIK